MSERLYRVLRLLPSSPAMAFWLVAAIACGVNLLVISLAPWTGTSQRFGGQGHDGYLELARNLLAGNGFVFEPSGPPALHRPPLYPLLLVPVVALPEPVQQPVLIAIQSGLVGGIAAIVWKIGTRLFGPAVARVAVGVMLLDPWLISAVRAPMSIVLQGFLYTTFSWLLLQACGLGEETSGSHGRRREPVSGLRLALLLGVNAGALALTHGTKIVTCGALLAGVGLWRLWQRDLRSAASAVAACALMLVIIAPWTVRNWVATGLFIPVVGNSGFSYFVGNAHWGIGGQDPVRRREKPWEAGLRHSGIDRPAAEVIRFFGNTDPVLETELNRRMIQHVRSRPDEFLLKFSLNAVEYYFPLFHLLYLRSVIAHPSSWMPIAREKPGATAITLFHSALWALCFAAVVLRSRTRPQLRAALSVLVLIAAFSVAYFPFLVFVGHSQYVLPTIPLLSVLAAVGLGPARVREADALIPGLWAVR